MKPDPQERFWDEGLAGKKNAGSREKEGWLSENMAGRNGGGEIPARRRGKEASHGNKA
jgi:hypothetical protein